MLKAIAKKRLILLVLIWFVACTGLILGLSLELESEFDPNLTLSQGLMSMSFEQDLLNKLDKILVQQKTNKQKSAVKGSLFHIMQGNCFCEWLANSHKNKLSLWSDEHQFSSISVNLTDYPELNSFIPSTPAIVAISNEGKLLYLGPYSRGKGCFTSSGEVDKILSNYVASPNFPQNQQNAIIDTDSSGCYCKS